MDAILLLLVPPERERKREIKPLTPFLRSEWPLVLSLTEIGAPTRHGGAGENYRPHHTTLAAPKDSLGCPVREFCGFLLVTCVIGEKCLSMH